MTRHRLPAISVVLPAIKMPATSAEKKRQTAELNARFILAMFAYWWPAFCVHERFLIILKNMLTINPGNAKTVIAVLLLTGLVFLSCTRSSATLSAVKQLPWYPSGSALVYHNSHLYLVGDNATQMLIMDSALRVVDSVRLVAGNGFSIEKSIKPDLEAITLIDDDQQVKLLIVGSGAVVPYREQCFVVSPKNNNDVQQFDVHAFYAKLKTMGLRLLNIEGAATVKDQFILANRGNKGNPQNHLIITPLDFYKTPGASGARLLEIEIPAPGGNFAGISGLEYAAVSRRLFLTVSTENTADNYNDGAIGKSFLMIINNFDERMGEAFLRPDRIIDLGQIDKKFVGQKIESAAVVLETDQYTDLVLAADNDKADSWLFKLRLYQQ